MTNEYSPNEDRPLKGYIGAMAAFGTYVGCLFLSGRLLGRKLPKQIGAPDLALIGVATHKLSRIVTKDAVTSPLRAPFNTYTEPAGAGEVNEEVRVQHGIGHAMGELISCPFCFDVWIATSFVAGLVLAPKVTRMAAATFVTTSVADSLHFAYSALKETE